jgi:hypothetical protein
MARKAASGWAPAAQGWSLLDAATGAPVTPDQLITDAPIEMTDWEVHHCAVQVVRERLEGEGRTVLSSQSNPRVHPSLWFVGESGPEWVIVRAARHPADRADPPHNLADIAAHCSDAGQRGYFASVSLVGVDEDFDSASEGPGPLWRGGMIDTIYEGLEPVAPARQPDGEAPEKSSA